MRTPVTGTVATTKDSGAGDAGVGERTSSLGKIGDVAIGPPLFQKYVTSAHQVHDKVHDDERTKVSGS